MHKGCLRGTIEHTELRAIIRIYHSADNKCASERCGSALIGAAANIAIYTAFQWGNSPAEDKDPMYSAYGWLFLCAFVFFAR